MFILFFSCVADRCLGGHPDLGADRGQAGDGDQHWSVDAIDQSRHGTDHRQRGRRGHRTFHPHRSLREVRHVLSSTSEQSSFICFSASSSSSSFPSSPASAFSPLLLY